MDEYMTFSKFVEIPKIDTTEPPDHSCNTCIYATVCKVWAILNDYARSANLGCRRWEGKNGES